MKPVKATLQTSFVERMIHGQKGVLKRDTELLILGKWENSSSRTGLTYLTFHPETKTFMELDSGHLKVENKEGVKLELPKFAYGESGRERELDGSLRVSFTPRLIMPSGECKPTLGKYGEESIVVVGVIESSDYPSGAGFILYQPKKRLRDEPLIVDSLEVEILEQGNMIKM